MSLWRDKIVDNIRIIECKSKSHKSQVYLQLTGNYRAIRYINNNFAGGTIYGPDEYLDTVREEEELFLAQSILGENEND